MRLGCTSSRTSGGYDISKGGEREGRRGEDGLTEDLHLEPPISMVMLGVMVVDSFVAVYGDCESEDDSAPSVPVAMAIEPIAVAWKFQQ